MMTMLSIGETYPIDCHEPNDIFLVAYPKSGITWFQHLLSGIMYGVDPSSTRFGEINKLVPDVHYKKEYTRRSSPTAFKSHKTPMKEYMRVIYLSRDGRDVAVSFYHYCMQKYKTDVTYEKVIDGCYASSVRWAEHVRMWKENPYGAAIKYVTYESLLLDPLPVLKGVAKFVGKNISDEKILEIVEQASFEKLKQKEKKWGLDNPAWDRENVFFRKGKMSEYKNELPENILNSFIALSSEALKMCGYLTE